MTTRKEAVEAMAEYVASVGSNSLSLVGIWVDVEVRAGEIRKARGENSDDD